MPGLFRLQMAKNYGNSFGLTNSNVKDYSNRGISTVVFFIEFDKTPDIHF